MTGTCLSDATSKTFDSPNQKPGTAPHCGDVHRGYQKSPPLATHRLMQWFTFQNLHFSMSDGTTASHRVANRRVQLPSVWVIGLLELRLYEGELARQLSTCRNVDHCLSLAKSWLAELSQTTRLRQPPDGKFRVN